MARALLPLVRCKLRVPLPVSPCPPVAKTWAQTKFEHMRPTLHVAPTSEELQYAISEKLPSDGLWFLRFVYIRLSSSFDGKNQSLKPAFEKLAASKPAPDVQAGVAPFAEPVVIIKVLSAPDPIAELKAEPAKVIRFVVSLHHAESDDVSEGAASRYLPPALMPGTKLIVVSET